VHDDQCPHAHVCLCVCVCVWTNLQRGRQYAQAVQALVELRVGGPPEERLPALGLTFGVRPATQRAHAALLAGAEQVAQGGALAAAFTRAQWGGGGGGGGEGNIL